MKKIDPKKSVYELTEQYPELIDILGNLGFLGIRNPVARKTLGRATTLVEGCKRLKKDLRAVITTLKQEGFEIVGEEACD